MAEAPVSTRAEGEAAAAPATTELDAVFGELAHAVFNALNTISAASELARMSIARKAPDDAVKPLARIESECMRAARLIRDGRAFMTFKIADAGEELDVPALLRDCGEAASKGMQLQAAPGLPRVTGDRRALQRAFTEILGNAARFGAGPVRVVLDATGPSALRIEFHDDGPGLSASVERIFEPFFSTQPNEHSGLGLALAARIIAAHGGRLGIQAVEGQQGACFWIELPALR